jgi:chromosome segregation protein
LSDSGIGREMHVVVGQGQLETILHAKPEDRRALIEEAAGVLKHRKRKEKALRKLDATQANLTRLNDLTAELRRTLKPLGKQAEAARRAAGVQAKLRDAKLRLAADDLVRLRTETDGRRQREDSARARRVQLETALAAARTQLESLEAQLAQDGPRLSQAQDTWYRLSAVQERLRGTVRLAAERARHLEVPAERSDGGRDPDELEAQAAEVADREATLAAETDGVRARLARAVTARAEAEAAQAAAERAHLAAMRAIADRQAGLATLSGRVEALRSTTTATTEEIDRLAAALAQAQERTEQADRELAAAQLELGTIDSSGHGLDERCTAALDAHESASKRVAELVASERETEQQRAHWQARIEAFSMGLTRRDGAGALLDAQASLPGLRGSLATLLTVEPGWQSAVAAAFGALADSVAVASTADAVAALELLREQDAGRVSMLVGGADTGTTADTAALLPEGARWVAELVQAPGWLRPAVHVVLRDIAAVENLAAAQAMVSDHPGIRAVTRDGDLLGADWATGGSGRDQSVLEVQAAVDAATKSAAQVDRELAELLPALEGARAEEAARLADVQAAQETQAAAQARRGAAAQTLGRLEQALSSARAEAVRLHRQRETAEARRADAVAQLVLAEQRLGLAREEPTQDEPAGATRELTSVALAAARAEEIEARLALRTAEERHRAIAGRADGLRRAATAEREKRARTAGAKAARERGAAVARAVRSAGEKALERIAVSLSAAAAERDEAAAARAERQSGLEGLRTRVNALATELAELTDVMHRDEVARAQSQLRIEQLESRISEDHGVAADDLVAEYGPHLPVPVSAAELAEHAAAIERGEPSVEPTPAPYDRAVQQRRAALAEKDLALLGRVNPLALEEFAAMEERYKFLATQLEDIKATRRDLLTVVSEVDDKILEVFTAAYADVAREFELVFAALFPGGEGRLVLTEPDDMLASGVDVEARPPGKKIKRLSLLSGGEKSLTAVAMLVAIFRARPSPFYVLDEVEAALDDVNLRRLIGLLDELRRSSQLIIVTHQKPTMEVADVLYGVSMAGDGITAVVSQRLRDSSDRTDRVAAG